MIQLMGLLVREEYSMKLCVFFGTFNPIHNVHLAMANFVKNKYQFDMILFVPAYKPPHKEVDDELAYHRYDMVRLAIEGFNDFNISNIEFQNEKFSYTANTLEKLYERFAIDDKAYFIIGSDSFKNIWDWYDSDRLKDLANFLVFPREDNFNPETLERFKTQGFNYEIVEMPFMNLSSTIVRSRVKKGKPINSLVPQKVLGYIQENELYLPKTESELELSDKTN